MKYILLSITILTLLSSCTDVIMLDLEESAQRYVIEGNINLNDSSCVVKISQTEAYYETNDFNGVENASITLNLSNGQSYILNETETGTYKVQNIAIQPGDSAFLAVSLSTGESFAAAGRCPTPVLLDSLSLEESPSPVVENGYLLYYHFNDVADEINYYRVKVWENGTKLDGYVLLDDEQRDGQTVGVPYFGTPFESGAALLLQLLTVNQAYFEYFEQVSEVQDQGNGAAAPYNPKGNFGSEVLGYFGMVYGSEMSIVVP